VLSGDSSYKVSNMLCMSVKDSFGKTIAVVQAVNKVSLFIVQSIFIV
jgi:hypothetical protein